MGSEGEDLAMTDKVIVYTSCRDAAEAEKLARHLVERRLAASVSIVPAVRSFYRWKGDIQDEQELLLMIKASRGSLTTLRREIEKLHSYDLPQLVAIPIVDGSPNYLAWLERELAAS